MLRAILARIQQGYRTMKYPAGPPPPMSSRYRGRPEIDPEACAAGCVDCGVACPTGALSRESQKGTDGVDLRMDLGKCLFCGECERACPRSAIAFSKDYRLSTRAREALIIRGGNRCIALARALDKKLVRLFGHSLKLRQVSAGGCNACETDLNVLATVGWDIGRFGIQFVASPRHADGLIVTGPVTKNMELALRKTYDALCEPRIVIASGACAISGGAYAGLPAAKNGVTGILPVDLFIPGCPPHPLTVLDGLLRLIGRIDDSPRGRARRKEGWL